MGKVTVEVDDDEILVAIKRPEDYEDVAAELLMEDILAGSPGAHFAAYRCIEVGNG